MLTDDDVAALEAAWAPARASGALGSVSIETLWEHTAGFASAVCSSFSGDATSLALDIVDVGTGAGVPGVLLARQLPACRLTLVDSFERRLDHVRRAARALGVVDRVEVLHGTAEVLGHDPAYRERFDVAVARLLADPSDAMELLVPLVRNGGFAVVSTAAASVARWDTLPVDGCPTGPAELTTRGDDWFAAVRRIGPVPRLLPRRAKIRRRSPLLPA